MHKLKYKLDKWTDKLITYASAHLRAMFIYLFLLELDINILDYPALLEVKGILFFLVGMSILVGFVAPFFMPEIRMSKHKYKKICLFWNGCFLWISHVILGYALYSWLVSDLKDFTLLTKESCVLYAVNYIVYYLLRKFLNRRRNLNKPVTLVEEVNNERKSVKR